MPTAARCFFSAGSWRSKLLPLLAVVGALRFLPTALAIMCDVWCVVGLLLLSGALLGALLAGLLNCLLVACCWRGEFVFEAVCEQQLLSHVCVRAEGGKSDLLWTKTSF